MSADLKQHSLPVSYQVRARLTAGKLGHAQRIEELLWPAYAPRDVLTHSGVSQHLHLACQTACTALILPWLQDLPKGMRALLPPALSCTQG